MTQETEAMNALLEDMMMQTDDKGRQIIRKTFKQAIECYAADLLEHEEEKQPQDELAALQSMTVEALAGLGLIAAQRVEWDKVGSIQEFNLELLKIFSRVLKQGGSLYLFGKDNCIDFIDYRKYLTLNRRIIWYQPSRLSQGKVNYTNNYDLICYFSKGKAKTFNLDNIRVPQMVELEHRLRCEKVPSVVNGKYGKTKFNPNGKNPGDVWGDIKQLTYHSKELVSREMLNTIQKPEKLIERLVLASSNENDVVLDPFSGVGTTMSVCKKLNFYFRVSLRILPSSCINNTKLYIFMH